MAGRAFVFVVVCAMLAMVSGEGFSERLTLRPLPDGKVLARFEFVNSLDPDAHPRHHALFPKAMIQIIQTLKLREMDLSFTQGRWDHARWGAADIKPAGVELRAHFHTNDADALWRNLTHALSGLFCASLNFLEDPALVARPSGSARRAALPREAVCTENLTPWLKLLPCRDRAGLSTLLERPRIHNAHYYSLQVRIQEANLLSQTLTVVLRLQSPPNWSLSSLFGRSLLSHCPLASSSHVHLDLDSNLVKKLKEESSSSSFNVTSNVFFDLTTPPTTLTPRSDASLRLTYTAPPLDVGLSWRAFPSWSPPQAPFRVTQFLKGRGNGRGAIVSLVNANHHLRSDGFLTMFQIIPWYVRLSLHTLRVKVDGEDMESFDTKISPSEDRVAPSVLEIGVMIPRDATAVLITVEFEKGYLRIDEHPPDANRGFDIPAARFGFSGAPFEVSSDNLLVLLATPDFSMPYNVITFTMTALALYFGSLLNSLRLRSVGEVEEVVQPGKLRNLLARFRKREKVKTL